MSRSRGTVFTIRTLALVFLLVTSVLTVGGTISFAGATDVGPAQAANMSQEDDGVVYILVNKTVSNETVTNADHVTAKPGDEVTFNIQVLNDGTTEATVTVRDVLPAGFHNPSYDPSAGEFDPDTGNWTFETGPGGLQELEIVATVAQPGSWTNKALAIQVDPGHHGSVDTLWDTATVTVIPDQVFANLNVSKSVFPEVIDVGDTATFTVNVTNEGEKKAREIHLMDSLPDGLDYISHATTLGSYDPGSGVWGIKTLDVDQSASLTLTVNGTEAGTFTNVANITASQPLDPEPGNNEAEARLRVRQTSPTEVADLGITKSVDSRPVTVGDDVEFTLTVANYGPNATSNVTVTDVLPANLSFAAAIPDADYDPTTGLWTVGDLAVDETRSLTIIANADSVGTAANTAVITASDLPDDNISNNTATVTVNITEGPEPDKADLSVDKTANNSTVTVGDHVEFTVNVTNEGGADTTGVELSDTLPPELVLRSHSTQTGSFDANSGIWTIGSLQDGQTVSLTLVVNATTNGTFTNVANITSSDVQDSDPRNNDDTASVTVEPAKPPLRVTDLGISKGANNSSVTVGDHIQFTLTVTNNGENHTANVTVRDVLENDFDFVDASLPAYNASTGIWSVGDLAAGAHQTLTITAEVLTAGTLNNTATITSSDLDDTNPDNDTVTITVQSDPAPAATDLALSKGANETDVSVGDHVAFTVSVTNNGPDDSSGVEVTDSLPTHLEYVSHTPGQSYDSTTGIWTIGTLSNGSTATIIIVANATATGSFTNVANITASDATELETNNDSDSAVVNVTAGPTPGPTADLTIDKTANQTTVSEGDDVRFTMPVTNNGPDGATNVTVVDTLPVGLEYIEAPGGSFDPTTRTVTWAISSLAAGANESLTLVVNATANATNSVTVTSEVTESNETDNTDTESVTVYSVPPYDEWADLVLNKDVNESTVTVGDQVQFTLELTNLGQNATTNITVEDKLPAGLVFISAEPAGEYNPTTGVWTIDTLAVGESVSLVIDARANQTGDITNDAAVTASDLPDTDPDNNQRSVTVIVQPVALADLQVTKTATSQNYGVTDPIEFTITVHNDGPETATGVTVTDQLPAGVTFDLASDGGLYNATDRTVVWTVGTLASGASKTLTLGTTATSTGTWQNQVSVTSDIDDPESANNLATWSVQIFEAVPDLDVSIVGPDTVAPGESYQYTVSVTNHDAYAVSGVTVQDAFDVFADWNVSVTTTTGNNTTSRTSTPYPWQDVTVLWDVGSLGAGQTETMTITVDVAETAPHEWLVRNYAEVSPGGDWDDVYTTIEARTDLAVTKSADRSTVHHGGLVEFTVEVTNNGPNLARGVMVWDTMSPDLHLMPGSVLTSHGELRYNEWRVGTLASGETATLTFQAVVSPQARVGDTLDNTVQAIPAFGYVNPDPDLTDNEATETVTVGPLPPVDLAVEKTVSNATVTGAEHVSAFVGQNVTYTITVTNTNSTTAAGQILIEDRPGNLPVGEEWEFVQTSATATSGVWHWTGAAGYWMLDRLPGGANATLTVTGYYESIPEGIDPPRTVQNLVEVSSANADPVPSNDRDVAEVSLWNGSADLAVNKTVQRISQDTLFDPDQEVVFSPPATNVTTPMYLPVRFTVNVTNTGPDDASGLVITDTLPDGLVIIDVPLSDIFGRLHVDLDLGHTNVSHGSFDSATGEWQVGTLPAGEQATLRFTAVPAETGSWTNLAAVTASQQYDGNRSNDQADATVLVIDQPSGTISISKTVANETVSGVEHVRASAGENVTYTLRVTNTGNDTESPLVLDPILGLLTNPQPSRSGEGSILFVETDNTTTQGTWRATLAPDLDPIYDGLWDIGLLEPGENATLTVTGHYTELAVLVFGGEPIRNEAFAGTYLGGFDSDSANVRLGARADLTLEKRVSNATVSDAAAVSTGTGPDEPVTYTFTLTNNGPEDTPMAYVVDPILMRLGAAETLGNESAWVETSNVSTQGNWTSELFGQSMGGSGIWNVGALPANSSATLTVTGYFNEDLDPLLPGPVLLTNFGIALGTADPNPADNQAPANVTIYPTGDVGVEKTVSDGTVTGDHVTVALDQAFTYNITVTADRPGVGPIAADDPMLGLLLDGVGTGFVLANETTTGTWIDVDNASGEWFVTLPENETSARLSVTGSFASEPADTVRNTVTVDAPFLLDRNRDNNTDEASVRVRQVADLALDKHVSMAGPVAFQQPGTLTVTDGDTVRYSIRVHNDGPNMATDVVVSEYLPAGLTLAAPPVLSQGTYSQMNGTWVVGDIPANDTAMLELEFLVNATENATLRNIAQVAESRAFDPDSTPGNNVDAEDDQDSVIFEVRVGPTPPPAQSADLELAKTVNQSTVLSGESVRFTLELQNTGPDTVTEVTVIDYLPEGLDVTAADPGMDFLAGIGIWEVRDIAPGETRTVNFTARGAALVNGTLVRNVAETRSSSLPDPDSTPGNLVETEDDYATTDVWIGPAADLELDKRVDRSTVRQGNRVTFTIDVTNTGPQDATGVEVVDTLPAGVPVGAISSSEAIALNASTNSFTWTVDSVGTGSTRTLTVSARIDAAPPARLENVAEIAASDLYDPDSVPGNANRTEDDLDTASVRVTTPPTPPDDDDDADDRRRSTWGDSNVTLVSATLNRTDVTVGQAVRIVGEINNTGTAPGRIVVAPLVDGTAVGTEKTRWVGSKDTYSMPFTVVFDEPGTFEVALRDRTHSRTVIAGNVTVEVLVVPTTTTTTTTATPTPTTTTTTAPPTTTTTTTTAPPVEEPAGFNPWWILVILLLALLGLGYREYRRRQQGV